MSDRHDYDTEDLNTLPLVADQGRSPAAAARVGVEVAARTHRGLVREQNEDHYLVARLSRTLETLATNVPAGEMPQLVAVEGYIFAVADGLGGHAAGERASRLVIRNGLELILSSANWALKINAHEAGKLVSRMRDYFVEIDRSLLRIMQSDPSLEGMATTLTVAYTVGLQAFVVHVGDSRVYRYHDGQLEQMTRDHTVAQSLADAGAIGPAEIRNHSKRHVLTNVISGRPGEVKPDVATFPLHAGDALLLCSDGLHGLVSERHLAELLRRDLGPDETCDRLVSMALQNGGRDNVTAVLARYHDPGLSTESS
jgi:protein phosphatase